MPLQHREAGKGVRRRHPVPPFGTSTQAKPTASSPILEPRPANKAQDQAQQLVRKVVDCGLAAMARGWHDRRHGGAAAADRAAAVGGAGWCCAGAPSGPKRPPAGCCWLLLLLTGRTTVRKPLRAALRRSRSGGLGGGQQARPKHRDVAWSWALAALAAALLPAQRPLPPCHELMSPRPACATHHMQG